MGLFRPMDKPVAKRGICDRESSGSQILVDCMLNGYIGYRTSLLLLNNLVGATYRPHRPFRVTGVGSSVRACQALPSASTPRSMSVSSEAGTCWAITTRMKKVGKVRRKGARWPLWQATTASSTLYLASAQATLACSAGPPLLDRRGNIST